jgi:polar amino acid transport system substrate-binding protein
VQAKSEDVWVLTNLEPPFSQVDERGKLNGYAVELVENILLEAGIKQTILAAPWKRVLQEGKKKANVLIFAVARTPEREQDFHWISPITANIHGIYSLKSNLTRINRLQDVGTLGPIGVLDGDVRHQLLSSINKNNVQVYSDWANVIQALLSGQVKSVFFSDAGVEYFCKKNAWDCADIQRVFTHQTVTSYLVVSKPSTKQALVNTLTQAAKRYKQSNDYKRLGETWLDRYRQDNQVTMHRADGVINLWHNPE